MRGNATDGGGRTVLPLAVVIEEIVYRICYHICNSVVFFYEQEDRTLSVVQVTDYQGTTGKDEAANPHPYLKAYMAPSDTGTAATPYIIPTSYTTY